MKFQPNLNLALLGKLYVLKLEAFIYLFLNKFIKFIVKRTKQNRWSTVGGFTVDRWYHFPGIDDKKRGKK